MKKILFKTAVLTALSAAAISLAACGSKSSASMTIAGNEGVYAETYADVSYDSSMNEEAAPQEAPENGLTDSSGSVAGNGQAAIGRKLIRNVSMDVETDTFDDLLSKITDQIRTLNGYVEQSNISGRKSSVNNESHPRYANITARIPSDKLDSFITAVEESGNVINKSENTQDVTLQYSDIESRKKSTLIEQDRLWALLEKADTLEAVISLEERLSDIRYELESMESQLRLYDNQVDYSTVTLSVREVTVFTPTAPETIGQRIANGFTHNFKNASDFCVNFIISLIAGSPIWVPVVIFLLLLLYLARRHRKKYVFPGSDGEKPEKKKLTELFKKDK